jgi:putative hemolysin
MTVSSIEAAVEHEAVPANLPKAVGFSAGKYSVKLATTADELAGAQALRYQSLYVEAGGKPKPEWVEYGREMDIWDGIAYHVIVIDKTREPGKDVVGCLRLLSNLAIPEGQGFYTEESFDISALRANYKKILELSRFCVDPTGRSGSILLMIWRFTLQVIVDNGFDLMIGCASFKGTDLHEHEAILSYLYDNNLAPPHLQPKVKVSNSIKITEIHQARPEWDEAKKAVPTLLRGYLKIGAKISDTAVIDDVFNTTFVTIYVDASQMVAQNHTLVSSSNGEGRKSKLASAPEGFESSQAPTNSD